MNPSKFHYIGEEVYFRYMKSRIVAENPKYKKKFKILRFERWVKREEPTKCVYTVETVFTGKGSYISSAVLGLGADYKQEGVFYRESI